MSLPFYALPLHEQFNKLNSQLYAIRLENQRLTQKEIQVENNPENDDDYKDAMRLIGEAEKKFDELSGAMVRLSNIPFTEGAQIKITTVTQQAELITNSRTVSFIITSLKNILRNLRVFKVYLNENNTKILNSKYGLMADDALPRYKTSYYGRGQNIIITNFAPGQDNAHSRLINTNYNDSVDIVKQYKELLDYALVR